MISFPFTMIDDEGKEPRFIEEVIKRRSFKFIGLIKSMHNGMVDPLFGLN
jgi:hypothetical protein